MCAFTPLEAYYNKFNEDKRLLRPHGRVEFLTTMHFIHEVTGGRTGLRILDVGAGTGRYAVPLCEEGHEVTAVELVRYNLGILRKKGSGVLAFQGNALDLGRFPDCSFDIVLELGPLYHLMKKEEQLRALSEAYRVLLPGGVLFAAYCMNEYAVLVHGFREGKIREAMEQGKLSEDFRCTPLEEDLYHYMRTEEIEALGKEAGFQRVAAVSQDGPANYMRKEIREMDEEAFRLFMEYHLSTCRRPDLLGAGAHVLDILRKPPEV